LVKIFNALTLILLGSAGLLQAQSEQPSLGEVARSNNHSKKAVLVVTEDNISSIGGTVSVVGSEQVKSSDSGAPAPPKKTADSASTAPPAKTAEVADLKKNLNSAKQELEGWKQAVKQYENLLATEGDEFRRQTYQTALENDRTNVTRSQQKVDEAQAALAKAQQASSAPAAAGTGTPPPNGTKEP